MPQLTLLFSNLLRNLSYVKNLWTMHAPESTQNPLQFLADLHGIRAASAPTLSYVVTTVSRQLFSDGDG